MASDVKSVTRDTPWVLAAPNDQNSTLYEADFSDGHRRYGVEVGGQINSTKQCSLTCKVCHPTSASFISRARAALETPTPYQDYLLRQSKTA